jgi:hypothetical protein
LSFVLIKLIIGQWLETHLEPIGACDYSTGHGNEDEQQDKATTTTSAGGSASKAKAVLKRIKQPIEKQQFQQT